MRLQKLLSTPWGNVIVTFVDAFGQAIKSHREALKLNQSELGELLGTNRDQVGRWERGEQRPEPKRIDLIARVLQIEKAKLLDLWTAEAGETSLARTAPSITEDRWMRLERKMDRLIGLLEKVDYADAGQALLDQR